MPVSHINEKTWQFTTSCKDDGSKVTELKQQISQKMILLRSTLLFWGNVWGPISASSKCTSSSLGIHITLHLPAEFRPNRTIPDRVMTSYPFFKMAPRYRNSTSGFGFVSLLIWEGQNLPAYQISARYLDQWPRYYYFRFKETNVRHVGILLSVPILRMCHHRHVILHLHTKFRPNRTIRDRVMTLYPFFKMAVITQIELSQDYCRPPTKFKMQMRVSGRFSNFDSIGFIVSETLLFCVVRFWLEIASLRGCIRRTCAEWRVNLLPG